MRRARGFVAGLVTGVLVLLGLLLALPAARHWLSGLGTDRAETMVEVTLQAVRREQKLLVFVAWVTADVTSTVEKTFLDMAVPGTAVRKTMIVPGLVRYAVDLSQLGAADLDWNEPRQTLTVRMPPVQPLEPAIRLDRMRVFTEQGLLAPATDAAETADQMNREAIGKALKAEAQAPELMRMAGDAAVVALEATLLPPLRAAGHENARVEVVRPALTAG